MRRPRLVLGGVVLSLALSACSAGPDATPVAGPTPEIALSTLTGVSTQLELAPSFLAATRALTLATFGSATRSGLTLSFPITSGTAAYYVPGSRTPPFESAIRHDGSGITFTQGRVTVTMTDLVVDAGAGVITATVGTNGLIDSQSATVFTLDESHSSLTQHGTDKVDGITATMDTAGLAKAFPADDLPASLPAGDLTITLS